MEPTQDPNRSRNTFRLLAVAAGLWFLGSGVWGLLTETAEDRAISGCEAAARAKAEQSAQVQHTDRREDVAGWSVTGEVRQSVDEAVKVTVEWTCLTDAEGRSPNLTAWNPVG